MLIAGTIIAIALEIYLGLLIARMVLSWVQVFAPTWEPRGVVLVLLEAVMTLTDPPLRFFGRFLPVVRTGGVGFSLGFMATFICVLLLQRLNTLIFLS